MYCVSSGDCWSVGQYEQNGAQQNQILHWNGKGRSASSAPRGGQLGLRWNGTKWAAS